jgi:RNA polymerase subunit RPABC4/transcription elongation factor Spt4
MIGTFSLLGIVVFSIVYKKVYIPSKKPKHRKVKVKKEKKRKGIIKDVEIFCPFCNSVITSEQKFCRYCGSNLKETENN